MESELTLFTFLLHMIYFIFNFYLFLIYFNLIFIIFIVFLFYCIYIFLNQSIFFKPYIKCLHSLYLSLH